MVREKRFPDATLDTVSANNQICRIFTRPIWSIKSDYRLRGDFHTSHIIVVEQCGFIGSAEEHLMQFGSMQGEGRHTEVLLQLIGPRLKQPATGLVSYGCFY